MYAVESRLRHQDRLSDYISSLNRSHEIRATAPAYLDMVNVFSIHDVYSRQVDESHSSVLHRSKKKAIHLLVTEIVLCGTKSYYVSR